MYLPYFPISAHRSVYDSSSMIVMLALSDMCLGINSVIEGFYPAYQACDSDSNMSMCVFKACVSQFFGLSSFLWAAAMAHSSVSQISRLFTAIQLTSQGSQQSQHHSMLFYHILCWGGPLLSLAVALGTSSAGPSSSHMCWITVDHSGDNDSELSAGAAVLLFVLPLVAVELYLFSTFRWLAKIIKLMPAESTQALLGRVYKLLAVIVGLKLLFLCTRTLRLLYPQNQSFLLGLLVIVGAPLQGLGDYFIFRSSRPTGRLGAGAGGDGTSGGAGGGAGTGAGSQVQLQTFAHKSHVSRAGYSTVLNPLAGSGHDDGDGDLDDGPLRGSAHSGMGLCDVVGDNDEEEDDLEGQGGERGGYATLVGDLGGSQHTFVKSGTGAGAGGREGDNDDESDEFDEVIFGDSPVQQSPDRELRRPSRQGLLDHL